MIEFLNNRWITRRSLVGDTASFGENERQRFNKLQRSINPHFDVQNV